MKKKYSIKNQLLNEVENFAPPAWVQPPKVKDATRIKRDEDLWNAFWTALLDGDTATEPSKGGMYADTGKKLNKGIEKFINHYGLDTKAKTGKGLEKALLKHHPELSKTTTTTPPTSAPPSPTTRKKATKTTVTPPVAPPKKTSTPPASPPPPSPSKLLNPTSVKYGTDQAYENKKSMRRSVTEILSWGKDPVLFPKNAIATLKNELFNNSNGGGLTISGTSENTDRLKKILALLCIAVNPKSKGALQKSLSAKGIEFSLDLNRITTQNAGTFTESLAEVITGIPNVNYYTWKGNEMFFDLADAKSAYSVKFSHSGLSAARNKSDLANRIKSEYMTNNMTSHGVIYGQPKIDKSPQIVGNEIIINFTITLECWKWDPSNQAAVQAKMEDAFKGSTAKDMHATGLNQIVKNNPTLITYGQTKISGEAKFPVPAAGQKFTLELPEVTDPIDGTDPTQDLINKHIIRYCTSILPTVQQQVGTWVLSPSNAAGDTQQDRINAIKKFSEFFKKVNETTDTGTVSGSVAKTKFNDIAKSLPETFYRSKLSDLLFEVQGQLGTWRPSLVDPILNQFPWASFTGEANQTNVLSSSTPITLQTGSIIEAQTSLFFSRIADELYANGAAGGAETTENLAAALVKGFNLNDEPLQLNFPWADVQSTHEIGSFLGGQTAWSVKGSKHFHNPGWTVSNKFWKQTELAQSCEALGLIVINGTKGNNAYYTNDPTKMRQIIIYAVQIPKEHFTSSNSTNRPSQMIDNNFNNSNIAKVGAAAKRGAIIINIPPLADIETALHLESGASQNLGGRNQFNTSSNKRMAQNQNLNTSSGAVKVTAQEALQTLFNLSNESNFDGNQKAAPASGELSLILYKVLKFLSKLESKSLKDVNDFYNLLKEIYDKDVDGSVGVDGKDILLPANESIDLNRWNVLSGLK